MTLFGAKMLGFFRLKIENVPLLFSRMQTCFKGLFLIHHILYCLLIIFVMEFNVREKYSKDVLGFLCQQFLILGQYTLYFGFGYANGLLKGS